MVDVAVVTTVHGRLDHLAGVRRGLARQDVGAGAVSHVVVRMGGPDPWRALTGDPPVVPVDVPLPTGPDAGRLPLAAARNAGARATRADLLVFLDVDCVPSAALVRRYAAAAATTPGLLAGPVAYLPPGADTGADGGTLDEAALAAVADPHPARPAPPAGELVRDERYELFWSLSFAVRRSDFDALGGFCEDYAGYGGEDTDLAFAARAAGMPLTWVGGAHAWHQHHPTQHPPTGHLADIVRNARVFRRRWGCWPMVGWLGAFADAGLVEWDPAGSRLVVR